MYFIISLLLLSLPYTLSTLTVNTLSYYQSHKSDGSVLLNIPSRIMWGWEDSLAGFCGELSYQSIHLYYGNYVSQQIIRNYAGGELLVGTNDVTAAEKMDFIYEEFDSDQTIPQQVAFIAWVKEQLNDNSPIVAGFFAQEYDDESYDHIMPIIGYDASVDGAIYFSSLYDELVMYDTSPYKSRSTCINTPTISGQPYYYCLPSDTSYAIALKGYTHWDKFLRAQLFVSQAREPDYSSEDGLNETPVLMSGYLIVSDILTNTNVTCLRFDNSTLIPDVTTASVNSILTGPYSHSYNAISTDTHLNITVDPFLSSGAYYFRCIEVPNSASTSTDPTLPAASISINPYSNCSSLNSTSICSWAGGTYCSASILRVFNKNDCCFSCKVCDSEAIASCPQISMLRTCSFNETSFHDSSPCCQTCIPPIPAPTCTFAQKSAISLCSTGIAPSYNSTGCPLCLAADGRSGGCTSVKLAACESGIEELPHCPSGQPPTRDPDSCCLNCKPVALNVTQLCDPTSLEVVNNCIDNIIPTLHTCQFGESRSYNFSNCCFTCNIQNTSSIVFPSPTSSPTDESSSASRCIRTDVSNCVEKMPVCGANEVAYNLPTQCCPSCTRPESICSPDLVVSCVNSSHSCAENETSSYVIDECCSTCIPEAATLPECQNDCDDDQVCMIMSDTLAECTATSQINILFNSTDSEKQYQLSNYDTSTMRMFLNELISRYCTGLSDIAICSLFVERGRDFDGNIESITHLGDITISVLLTLPNVAFGASDQDTSSLRRIKLMDHSDTHLSYLSLISAASTDPFAASGYSSSVNSVEVTQAPSEDEEATTKISFNLYGLIIGCAGAVVAVIILTLFLQRFVFNCNKDGPKYAEDDADEHEKHSGPSHFVEMHKPPTAQHFMKSNHHSQPQSSISYSIPPSTRLITEPSEDEVLESYLPKRASAGPAKTYALD